MGPLLVAILAVCFFAFALLSAVVSLFFGILALMHLVTGPSRILGAYVLGSGFAGGAALVLFGFAMRWNVVGDAIMKVPLFGCAAWAIIGFGWSAAAAFALASVVRWVFSRRASGRG
jgi:hypothetical protein